MPDESSSSTKTESETSSKDSGDDSSSEYEVAGRNQKLNKLPLSSNPNKKKELVAQPSRLVQSLEHITLNANLTAPVSTSISTPPNKQKNGKIVRGDNIFIFKLIYCCC